MKKVCIVGFGVIAPVHIAAIDKCESALLYGICDIDAGKKFECENKYGVKFYTDFDNMITDKSIDAIHICTPHYLHFEMIEKALEAGKKIVCEKPAVITNRELLSLKKSRGINDVCFIMQNRRNECIERLKEIISSGILGKIEGIKGILTWNRTADYYALSPWRGKIATEGGGVLINQSIHLLDLMVYLIGNIESVRAVMTNFSLDEYIEVEDTISAYLKFDNNITGMFFATNANKADDDFQLEMYFEKGNARYIFGKLFINGEEVCENRKFTIGKKYWGNSHEKIICDFYDKDKFFCYDDIENTHAAMFAMYKSASNNGCEVSVRES